MATRDMMMCIVTRTLCPVSWQGLVWQFAKKLSHVHPDTPIHLIMDNVYGYGSIECFEQYKEFLWNKFNVKIINQIPNSFETFVLDLDTCMSIQAQVHWKYFCKVKRSDALAVSVAAVWDSFENHKTLKNIHERWKMVTLFIIQAHGYFESFEYFYKQRSDIYPYFLSKDWHWTIS